MQQHDLNTLRPSLVGPANLNRRGFLAGSVAAVCSSTLPTVGSLTDRSLLAAETSTATAESLVAALYETLTAAQREQVCRPWDYVHPKFGLLRTRVANNWNCNDTDLSSDFFTADQKQNFQVTLRVIGRMSDPREFESIILKNTPTELFSSKTWDAPRLAPRAMTPTSCIAGMMRLVLVSNSSPMRMRSRSTKRLKPS